jgi:hypothetical protein
MQMYFHFFVVLKKSLLTACAPRLERVGGRGLNRASAGAPRSVRGGAGFSALT